MFHDFGGSQAHSVCFGASPPKIVAVPGSIASWEVWLPTIEELTRRVGVVAIDHAGVGQSKFPADQISYEFQLELLEAVISDRELERFVLMGDSSNVALALDYALKHPSRVGALVLVAGVPWSFDTPQIRSFLDAVKRDFHGTIDAFTRACFPEEDSEQLVSWLRDLIAQTGPESVVAILESYFSIDLRDRLQAVDAPCLVLGGELDRVAAEGLEGLRTLSDSLSDAELVVLDGVGHVPSMSRPVEVAAEILDFLERKGVLTGG